MLLPLLGYNTSGENVRRRNVGLKFSVATKKIDVAGPGQSCHPQDVDEILASCDCQVNLDGVAWKDENEYIGCLIVHKTFSPCNLQRILNASICLPFPTPEPTIAPSSSPSTSVFPTTSILPSSLPSQSLEPTPGPSFIPSDYPSLQPTPNPTASPSLTPSGLSTAGQLGGPPDGFFDLIEGQTASTNPMLAIEPKLELVGNNQFPPEAFPLKICQGDCDSDKDCEGDLQCMPRNGLEKVPRCQGEGVRGKDYCTDPSPTEPWNGYDPFYKFRIRLFFDPLYFWQETNSETWHCMECTRCDNYTLGDGHEGNCTIPGPNTTSCMEDDNIWIMKCKRSRSDFQFNILKHPGSGDQIRVDSTNLCFSTLNNTYLELKGCNHTDPKQLWMPIVNLSKFELRPYWQSHRLLNESLCLTQMHHPKAEGELPLSVPNFFVR